jgi:hypothetical protein
MLHDCDNASIVMDNTKNKKDNEEIAHIHFVKEKKDDSGTPKGG